MDLSMRPEYRQKHVMSQGQLQSLEILAMDNLELQELLQAEYLENPLLEYTGKETGTDELERYYERAGACAAGNYEEASEIEDARGQDIPQLDACQLERYLLEQLDGKQYTDEQWEFLRYLIACLDDHGFFTMDLADAAEKNGLLLETAEKCLTDLKQLEPAGIFAGGLPECLLIQLERQGEGDSLAGSIAAHYLEEVAGGKISVISRALGVSTARVRAAVEQLRSLNPRPLQGLYTEPTAFVVPDVCIRREENRWEIELLDSWRKDYRISDYYLGLMRISREEELKEYFQRKLERLQLLMESIEQRKRTLERICGILIKRQGQFLEGKEPLKPMTMTEAAELLELHPSTISRAVKGKYLQYPGGTIPMKELFAGAAAKGGAHGEEATAMRLKEYIRQLIREEDKKSPLSDQLLADKISAKGLLISRRTVAKYREELQIPGSFLRKEV